MGNDDSISILSLRQLENLHDSIAYLKASDGDHLLNQIIGVVVSAEDRVTHYIRTYPELDKPAITNFNQGSLQLHVYACERPIRLNMLVNSMKRQPSNPPVGANLKSAAQDEVDILVLAASLPQELIPALEKRLAAAATHSRINKHPPSTEIA